jgi:glycosyltransferase involved in cell wall biosynthesis
MRVLTISPRYRGGGAERAARELFESLQAAGTSASMLVAIRQEGDPASVSQMRLPGERWLQVVRTLYWPVDWIQIGSKLALHRVNPTNFDLVHFHNIHGYWMSLGAIQKLCRRMPSVWTLHDEWAPTGGLSYDLSHVQGKYAQEIRSTPGTEMYFPDSPRSQRCRTFIDRRLPRPSLIICPSGYMQRLVRESGRFPETECVRVPYGLRFKELPDVHKPRSEARRELGVGTDRPVVLLVAAHLHTFYKGISLAIDALQLLSRTGFKVLIIGRGGEEIARRIPQQVVATGFLTDDRMIAAAYRAADVTLVPSLADNFPYVALESMACATPVVAFRIGGLAEMIGDNERGLAASPFDIPQFAGNIKQLLDSPELRQRLGNSGKQWVDQNCDMAQWTQKHLALYQQALNNFAARGLDVPSRSQAVVKTE